MKPKIKIKTRRVLNNEKKGKSIKRICIRREKETDIEKQKNREKKRKNVIYIDRDKYKYT